MSDTPRTDSALTVPFKRYEISNGVRCDYDEDFVPKVFALRLELELNEANHFLDDAREQLAIQDKLIEELKRDKERLDWLIANSVDGYDSTTIELSAPVAVSIKEIRQAIDKAMAKP